MRVLLFVLDVSMLRGCEDDDNAAVGDGGVFAGSVGHAYVGSTGGSDIVYSEANVLVMSVVRGMRGVGGE